MQAYAAVIDLLDNMDFEVSAPPVIEPLPSYSLMRAGKFWRVDVQLETTTDRNMWRISALMVTHGNILFWTGGTVCSMQEWEPLREELMGQWVQRGIDLDSEMMSGDETEADEG